MHRTPLFQPDLVKISLIIFGEETRNFTVYSPFFLGPNTRILHGALFLNIFNSSPLGERPSFTPMQDLPTYDYST